jgi:hypothetical protein
MKSLHPLIFLFFITFISCEKNKTEPEVDCTGINSDYETIKLILHKSCNLSGCHNQGSYYGDFTSFAGVKAKVEDGTFKDRVIIKKDMPSGGKLTTEEFNKIKCWLDNGAKEN